jgi:two-component system OmpR family sensor kinase
VNPFRHYVRRGMQRRIFVWFGISIAVTACVVARMMGFPGSASPLDRGRHFLADQFARVWADPPARSDLAAAITREFGVTVELTDVVGTPLSTARCPDRFLETAVSPGGVVQGYVKVCEEHSHHARAWLPVLIAVAMLWAASGMISRRLARPLLELSRVAQDIGRGQLKSRVRLPRRTTSEFALVGEAMNDMASRIEKQLADQRALLATVSHEIRTPLARMRLLIAMADGQSEHPGTPKGGSALSQLEREVLEIDTLVGDLLASSRLDFDAVTRTRLDARKVAVDALERVDVDVGRLVAPSGDTSFMGDATLVTRAVSNLLENAKRHGGGVQALRVEQRGRQIAFIVDDRGSGFEPGEEKRAFEPFYRRPSRPSGASADSVTGPAVQPGGGLGPAEAVDPSGCAESVGLGLALVRRIAEAHGGRAFAQNRPGGGAEVGIELARAD